MDPSLHRRSLLGSLGASMALAACSRSSSTGSSTSTTSAPATTGAPAATTAATAASTGPAATASGPGGSGVPRRMLGQTGVEVSMIGLGGHHIGIPKDDDVGIKIIRSAVDRGITFMDNCWDYHKGKSEERMGRALRDGYRNKVFLMTKLDGRTKQATLGQLEQSLRRLQTDHIDLVQIHEVIRDTDPKRVFTEGVIEALLEAKKAGKLRFIGFTGHKDPEIHLAMLREADAHSFRFDTVQMPLNVLDAHYRSFGQRVLPVLVEKKIGVLGMKPLAAGKIVQEKVASAPDCLRYALSLPTSVVITGCEKMEDLDQAIDVATHFTPMTAEQRETLLTATRNASADGRLEEFKTSVKHDGTTQNPKWLETATI